MAQSICDLTAKSRWAVTGTPIQNRLGDLAALLKFLQVYPYHDLRRFDADITQLWKSGEAQEAVKRLQKLSGCILLRRPKETINLPMRHDLRCAVEFNADERALYNEMKSSTIAQLDKTRLEVGDTSRAMKFVNVIQQINSLRLICDLGLHFHTRHDTAASLYDPQKQNSWSQVAQHAFNFQCETGSVSCHSCSSLLDVTEGLLGETSTQLRPQFSECLRFICSDCTHQLYSHSKTITCEHRPCHPIASVSTNINILEEETPQRPSEAEYISSLTGLPSKVMALVAQLKAQPADRKR